MDDTLRSRTFWDREVAAPTHASWLENPHARDYANRMIGGGEPMWPLDWFERWLGGRRFRRGLSVGCGTGALERDLIARGLVDRIDAFDGSIGSLAIAREEARRAGSGDRIRYYAADFNFPRLPHATYDIVLFHQSLHHVGRLERLLRAVMSSLAPDGIVYLDEFVGPSSTTWTPEQARHHRAAWELVPSASRRFEEVPYPIAPDDPSEAIRSGEIIDQLSIGFHITAFRPYGGNVLSAVYGQVDWSQTPASLLDALIARDAAAIGEGERSYYAIVVAEPRPGFAALVANAQYFVVPKIKRIGRELRKLLA